MKERTMHAAEKPHFSAMHKSFEDIHTHIVACIAHVNTQCCAISAGQFYRELADLLPVRTPNKVYIDAFEKLASDNPRQAKMGLTVFISLHLKTILSAIEPYRKLYTGDFDDVMQSTVSYIIDRLVSGEFKKGEKVAYFSQVVTREAQKGAGRYIAGEQHIPVMLGKVRNYGVFHSLMQEAHDIYGSELTPEVRSEITQKLSKQTKITEEAIGRSFNRIVHVAAMCEKNTQDMHERLENEEFYDVFLTRMRQRLTTREYAFIYQYFGFGDYGGTKQTLEKIGEAYGISRARVGKIIEEVVRKMGNNRFFRELFKEYRVVSPVLPDSLFSIDVIGNYVRRIQKEGRKGLGHFMGEIAGLDTVFPPYFFAGKKVIDIGCSVENLVRGERFENSVAVYDAIDPQTPEDTIIDRRFYYKGDITKIQKDPRFGKEAYDVCMLHDPSLPGEAVLKGIQYVLKTGGMGIIQDWESQVSNKAGQTQEQSYMGYMDHLLRSTVIGEKFTIVKTSFGLPQLEKQSLQKLWEVTLRRLVERGQIPEKFRSPDYYGNVVDAIDRLLIIKKTG
ncbi:MAG TPA: sigma factor-like helix-turn-helix DNA-binding protein [Patescibacteria group bacterium]|nr:sigma factor-like helix-turn-helix DNA-binding protein [Patescibacteria group bacterium]